MVEPKRRLLGNVGLWVFLVSTVTLVCLTSICWLLENQERQKRDREQIRNRSPNAASFQGGGSSQTLKTFKDFRDLYFVPLTVASFAGLILTLTFRVGSARLRSYASVLRTHTSEVIAIGLITVGCVVMTVAFIWLGRTETAMSSAASFDRDDLEARTFRNRPSPYGGTMTVIHGQPSDRAFTARNQRDAQLPYIGLLFFVGVVLTAAGLIHRWIIRRLSRRNSDVANTDMQPNSGDKGEGGT